KTDRLVERALEDLGQRVAVHLAGQAVEAREISEALLVVVALGDDADDAARARRTAVRTREPAAGVLDPELGCAARAGLEAVFGLIGDAGAGIRPGALHHGVVARGGVGRIEIAGIAAPGRDGRAISYAQHVPGIRPPGERVGVDAPVVRDKPDRREDAAQVGDCRGRGWSVSGSIEIANIARHGS